MAWLIFSVYWAATRDGSGPSAILSARLSPSDAVGSFDSGFLLLGEGPQESFGLFNVRRSVRCSPAIPVSHAAAKLSGRPASFRHRNPHNAAPTTAPHRLNEFIWGVAFGSSVSMRHQSASSRNNSFPVC